MMLLPSTSGRPGTFCPPPKMPPPFWAGKPEKITPRSAYSVVSGSIDRASGAPKTSSKPTNVEVIGGAMTWAEEVLHRPPRISAPVSNHRIIRLLL